MSVLGEFRRLPADRLERIRSEPGEAYRLLDEVDDMLDLDRAWQRLAALMDAAGFPVNPVTAGAVFPDERWAFGARGDSRALSADQVAAAAAHLADTPFEVLGAHLRPLLDAEPRKLMADPTQPVLEVPVPDETWTYRVDEDTERAIRTTLASSYAALVGFFVTAAKLRQCTVFWAA